jgi:aryl carrier-like protein
MFIRPTDPMPSVISFGATQGCTDLILLDGSLSVIPKTENGATGIVAFITRQSATHYLANDEASRHMFRPWNGEDMLLYTDDIGCMQDDGTIAIRGRSSRNVKVNGLFVDLDYVERALAPAFADKSLNVTSFKLVKSCATEGIVLFASTEATDAMFILKHARDCLRVSHNDDLAMVISAVRCIPEMPFNASYKIDLAMLQKMADSAESLAPGLSAEFPAVNSPTSKVDALAEKMAAEIAKLSRSLETVPTDMPLLYSGLNSITAVRLYMWLQSEYEYEEEMTHLFEEEVTAQVLATEILREEIIIIDESDVDILAEEIAAEITKLSKSLEAVPQDTPLLYSGLNSITMVRLHMWLQSEYEYEEEMSHLFDEEVTAQVLAREILGTESNADTVVEDGASEILVLEKDPDFTTEDSIFIEVVPEFQVQASNEPVRDFADEDEIPDIYVVGLSDDETCDPADEDSARQTIIVDESDSDHEVGEVESKEVIVSHRPPKRPLLDLKSPLRLAFPFSEKSPVSPSLGHSPLSFMFSSWITPLRGQETRRPLLDSILMLAV